MASNQKPRGSVVRNPPDWFGRYLMGAYINSGACVGNRTTNILYNNATDGSVLRIYGVNVQSNTNTGVLFKIIKGIVGTLLTGEGAPQPIDPRTPLQWGQVYSVATATGVGTAIGGISLLTVQSIDYAFNYPNGIVPPGYAFGVENVNTNATQLTGFRWLACYE